MTNRLRLAFGRPQQVRNDVTVKTLAASGGLAVGELTETTARKLSAVDGCMEILSNSISKLPNFVMDSRTREHVDHYLLRLLNVRPNEAMTPSIRRKVLENSRNEGGNGYDWIIRDPRTGIIQELIPVPWWLVQPWRDEAGRVWYTVTHPVTGTPMVSSIAMPANSNTSARKIFSKKRAIVWLVARSRWFWALRSSKRHMGADRHAPSARK